MPASPLSVALYCPRESGAVLKDDWFGRAVEFLTRRGFRIYWTEIDYTDHPLPPSPDAAQRRLAELTRALREHPAASVSLLAVAAGQNSPPDYWEASVDASLGHGYACVGMPESANWSPRECLLRAYDLFGPVAPFRYGTVYRHPADRGPFEFAVGITVRRSPPTPEDRDPVIRKRMLRWSDAVTGPQQYLDGWFRDVFPVSLLSRQHVATPVEEGCPLLDSGIGRFAPLGPDVWMWEVPEEQRSRARAALAAAGRLICP